MLVELEMMVEVSVSVKVEVLVSPAALVYVERVVLEVADSHEAHCGVTVVVLVEYTVASEVYDDGGE